VLPCWFSHEYGSLTAFAAAVEQAASLDLSVRLGRTRPTWGFRRSCGGESISSFESTEQSGPPQHSQSSRLKPGPKAGAGSRRQARLLLRLVNPIINTGIYTDEANEPSSIRDQPNCVHTPCFLRKPGMRVRPGGVEADIRLVREAWVVGRSGAQLFPRTEN